MAMMPLTSNFEGDFLLQVFVVDSDDDMDQVAKAAAYHSVGRRVMPQEGKILRVKKQNADAFFPRDMKVKDSGLVPTECVWITYADH